MKLVAVSARTSLRTSSFDASHPLVVAVVVAVVEAYDLHLLAPVEKASSWPLLVQNRRFHGLRVSFLKAVPRHLVAAVALLPTVAW